MTDKAALRKQFIAKRQSLDTAELAERSRKIFEHFKVYSQNQTFDAVHVFLSMLNRQEIDTSPIIDYLRSREKSVIVSRTNFKELTLSNYLLEESTELVKNKWGIPEPVNASIFPTDKIDLVLVPLLCFDLAGNRVGYGKGFYDRFLADCPPGTLKIGLSLFDPIQDIPVDDFDIPLDKCITPQNVYSFD